jgi:signal transduction histidine kinase
MRSLICLGITFMATQGFAQPVVPADPPPATPEATPNFVNFSLNSVCEEEADRGRLAFGLRASMLVADDLAGRGSVVESEAEERALIAFEGAYSACLKAEADRGQFDFLFGDVEGTGTALAVAHESLRALVPALLVSGYAADVRMDQTLTATYERSFQHLGAAADFGRSAEVLRNAIRDFLAVGLQVATDCRVRARRGLGTEECEGELARRSADFEASFRDGRRRPGTIARCRVEIPASARQQARVIENDTDEGAGQDVAKCLLRAIFWQRNGEGVAGAVRVTALDSAGTTLGQRLSTEPNLAEFAPRFNEMASEVEGLITRLRSAERGRIEVVQDIGHDLRHPLGSLRVLAETLATQAGRLSPEQLGEIRKLLARETLEIEGMLEDLVAMASLEDPSLRLQPETLHLDEAFASFAESFRALDSEKTLQLRPSEKDLALLVDRRLFLRMLRNALENARRFAASEVRLAWGEDREGIWVEVSDDGPGFSAQAVEWFQREERHGPLGRGEGSGRGAGLGLGSFVMRKIATLLGARIHVSNRPTSEGGGGRLRVSFAAQK